MSSMQSGLVAGLSHAIDSYLALRDKNDCAKPPTGRIANNIDKLVDDKFAFILRILTLFTAGVYYPWLQIYQLRRFLKALPNDNATFELQTSPRSLIWIWIATIPFLLAIIFSFSAVIVILISSTLFSFEFKAPNLSQLAIFSISGLAITIAIHRILFIFVICFYTDYFFRIILEDLRFGSLRFHFKGRPSDLLLLNIGNFILNFFSIGALNRLTARRTQAFWEKGIGIKGWV